MKKLGAILAIIFGAVFAFRIILVIYRLLFLPTDSQKDSDGLGILISYIIPIIIASLISFLLIRYGIRVLKKIQNENLPINHDKV